jgi:V-type H+-transporting ATPase subunit A
VVVAERMNGA